MTTQRTVDTEESNWGRAATIQEFKANLENPAVTFSVLVGHGDVTGSEFMGMKVPDFQSTTSHALWLHACYCGRKLVAAISRADLRAYGFTVGVPYVPEDFGELDVIERLAESFHPRDEHQAYLTAVRRKCLDRASFCHQEYKRALKAGRDDAPYFLVKRSTYTVMALYLVCH